MNPLILRVAARLLVSLMLLFSIYVLLKGHNLPGGGFIGGLIGVASLAIYGIAFGASALRTVLRIEPTAIAGIGLVLAIVSGLVSVFAGVPFLTGLWWIPDLDLDAKIALGTPLLFDIGVYLVVVGGVLAIILAQEEEVPEDPAEDQA